MDFFKNNWLKMVSLVTYVVIASMVYIASDDWSVRVGGWIGSLVVVIVFYSLFSFWKSGERDSPASTATTAVTTQPKPGERNEDSEDPNLGDVKNPVIRNWVYWSMIGIWIAQLVIIFYWLTENGFVESSKFLQLPLAVQLLYAGLLIWIGMSFKIIPLDNVAGITFFGLPVKNMGPGPKLIPWLLFEVNTFSRKVEQKQFPADPEFVFKGEDKEKLPDGMQRPLRVITGEPDTDSDSPLNIQMALEFLYFLRVQIDNPIVFIINFGSIEEFWRQMRDTGDRIITNRVSATPGVAALIRNIKTLMDELDERFKYMANRGGVRVIETGLSSPDITHSLSAAIREIGVKKAEAKQIKSIADAQKYRLTQEGQGRAAAEAALISAIKEVLATADSATIAAYAGQRVLGDKTVVLGAEGIAQAFGLGKMITRGDEK